MANALCACHDPRVPLRFASQACAAALLIACGPAAVAPAPTLASPETAPAKSDGPAIAEPEADAAPSQAVGPGTVVLNQHGFSRAGSKRAVVVRSGPAVPFTVTNSRGQTVLIGTTVPVAGIDPQSGTQVHRIDFSELDVAGAGFTVVVGGVRSDPFSVGRPYQTLARDSLGYFYQSRFAEAVEAPFVPGATPPLTRAAGHADSRYTCFSGTDLRGTRWPGCAYQLTVTGGWYDAGDYGQYAINTAWASWLMMNMAERAKRQAPRQCTAVLGDNSLAMPEAGNGMPDLLDEARRGMENLLSTQVASPLPQPLARGAQLRTGPLALTLTDASGMVHHKVHGERWHGDEALPATDTIPRFLYPPTTSATLSLAGAGAQCARVFGGVDAAFAARCLEAAEAAFAAAVRVPDAYAWGEFTGGGPYDDQGLNDEFGWAATELWLSTGKAEYAAAMDRYVPGYNVYGAFDWRNVEARGMLSVVLSDTGGSRGQSARLALQSWAFRLVEAAGQTHYGVPYELNDFYWGSNGGMMNRAVLLASAHDASGDPAQRAAVTDAMDYLLGRNPLGRSFVSGYGERPMRNPHHRFWRGGSDPSRPFPPPGVMSGGPNSVDFIDPVGSTLRGRCTGMTCWRDEYATYSMNEVAINWNASLAWVAHWLDRQDARCDGSVRDTTAYK